MNIAKLMCVINKFGFDNRMFCRLKDDMTHFISTKKDKFIMNYKNFYSVTKH